MERPSTVLQLSSSQGRPRAYKYQSSLVKKKLRNIVKQKMQAAVGGGNFFSTGKTSVVGPSKQQILSTNHMKQRKSQQANHSSKKSNVRKTSN